MPGYCTLARCLFSNFLDLCPLLQCDDTRCDKCDASYTKCLACRQGWVFDSKGECQKVGVAL